MNICEVKATSSKYQTDLQMSGISPEAFELIYENFINKNGRLPELDELPNVNTEIYLLNELDIKKSDSFNYTTAGKMQEITGLDNVDEARVLLNNLYKDLEINTTLIGNTVIVGVDHKPSEYDLTPVNDYMLDIENDPIKNKIILSNMLYKLGNLYGIKLNEITNLELSSPQWSDLIVDAHSVNAFIYNGEIYVNTDNASLDAPLHELSHIYTGAIRFTDPLLYEQLLATMEDLPNYDRLASLYKDRTMNDINEEIFVTLLANYLSGKENSLQNLDTPELSKLLYHVKRTLDTMVLGGRSAKSLTEYDLFNSSITDLCKLLKSDIFTGDFNSSLDNIALHRNLNNFKSDLMKSGDLIEECN